MAVTVSAGAREAPLTCCFTAAFVEDFSSSSSSSCRCCCWEGFMLISGDRSLRKMTWEWWAWCEKRKTWTNYRGLLEEDTAREARSSCWIHYTSPSLSLSPSPSPCYVCCTSFIHEPARYRLPALNKPNSTYFRAQALTGSRGGGRRRCNEWYFSQKTGGVILIVIIIFDLCMSLLHKSRPVPKHYMTSHADIWNRNFVFIRRSLNDFQLLNIIWPVRVVKGLTGTHPHLRRFQSAFYGCFVLSKPLGH